MGDEVSLSDGFGKFVIPARSEEDSIENFSL
jgi:hypothetical protein